MILSGHSHSVVSEPEIVNETPIMHSGSKAVNVGVLDISLNKETGEISVDENYNLFLNWKKLILMFKLWWMYKSESDELLNVLIGNTRNRLEHNARWGRAVSLGNLITDF